MNSYYLVNTQLQARFCKHPVLVAVTLNMAQKLQIQSLTYSSSMSIISFSSILYFRLSNRSVVDNGESLNGTSLWELRHDEDFREHSVRCILNIENWTAWRLKDPLAHNHCGYIHEKFPAPNVEPATREVMVGHKQVRTKVFGIGCPLGLL